MIPKSTTQQMSVFAVGRLPITRSLSTATGDATLISEEEQKIAMEFILNPSYEKCKLFEANEPKYNMKLSRICKSYQSQSQDLSNKIVLQTVVQNLFYVFLASGDKKKKNLKATLKTNYIKALQKYHLNLLFSNSIEVPDLFLIASEILFYFTDVSNLQSHDYPWILDAIICLYDLYLNENIYNLITENMVDLKKITPENQLFIFYCHSLLRFILAFIKSIPSNHKIIAEKNKFQEFMQHYYKIIQLSNEALYFLDNFHLLSVDYIQAVRRISKYEAQNQAPIKKPIVVNAFGNIMKEKNFETFGTSRIVLICHLLSAFSFFATHFFIADQIFLQTLEFLKENWSIIREIHLTYIIYALGKAGYCDEAIKILIEMEIKKLNAPNSRITNIDSLKYFFLYASNMNIVTKENFHYFEKKILSFYSMEKDSNVFMKSFVAILNNVARLRIWNTKIWDIFFKNIKNLFTRNLDFKIFFIMKVMHIFYDEIDNPELKNKATQFFNQNTELINKKSSDYYGQIHNFERKISTLEVYIEDLLIMSGIKFSREHSVGPITVDFYIPEYKLVIEAMGPQHLVKPIKQDNLMTSFKMMVCQKLNLYYLRIDAYGNHLKIIESEIKKIKGLNEISIEHNDQQSN